MVLIQVVNVVLALLAAEPPPSEPPEKDDDASEPAPFAPVEPAQVSPAPNRYPLPAGVPSNEPTTPQVKSEAPNVSVTKAGTLIFSAERLLPIVGLTWRGSENPKAVLGTSSAHLSTLPSEVAHVAVDRSFDGLTTGLQLAYGTAISQDSTNLTATEPTLTAGLRVGYVLPIGRLLAVWPRFAVGSTVTMEKNVLLTFDVPLVIVPASHFAIVVGPSFDRWYAADEVTRVGVDIGLSVAW